MQGALATSRRLLTGAVALLAMVAGLVVGVGQQPAEAAVTSVKGSACGYLTRFGLFGGPDSLKGCGQTEPPGTASSRSPSVALPADGSGSASPISATKPEGASAIYGPAYIFAGRWPLEANSPPPSGPISVSTQGTPAGGSVTTTADITRDSPTGLLRGFGPGPVEGDELHVSCTASETGVSGSTSIVNGLVTLTTDQYGAPLDMEPMPTSPPVNYTTQGVITNVGDFFSVVLNQQIVNPDGSLTVIGVHMYMFGPTGVGEYIAGQVTCGTTPSALPPGDRVPPTCRPPFEQTSANREWIGVFDTGGLQSITNIQAHNVTVQVGNNPDSPYQYLRFTPGQTGPVAVIGTKIDPAQPSWWSFDATDAAGNTRTCRAGNFPPVAADDTYVASAGAPFSAPAPGVLANDRDPEGGALTAGSASAPANGTVVLNANGSFTYTPNAGFVGSDSFTYVVTDSGGATDAGLVTISVSGNEATLLKDIVPGSASGSPWHFGQLGEDVLFLSGASVGVDDPATDCGRPTGPPARRSR